jgi:hypothetical protein
MGTVVRSAAMIRTDCPHGLAQLEQFGGGFYDFAIADASRIKGLDCARD